MRRRSVGAAFLFALAPIALAPGAFADTLKEVTTHGVIITMDQIGDVEVTYTPDGKFSAKSDILTSTLGGPLTGTWRIDGDKLCTTSSVQPDESCTAYPKDKKSGDTFPLGNAQGTVNVKIK